MHELGSLAMHCTIDCWMLMGYAMVERKVVNQYSSSGIS